MDSKTAFIKSLLNPEELGMAVPAHVRDAARVALGREPVESVGCEPSGLRARAALFAAAPVMLEALELASRSLQGDALLICQAAIIRAKGDALLVGDQVIVTKDDGEEVETTVRIAPWQLGHGEWVVGLVGISGGYSLSRVRRK